MIGAIILGVAGVGAISLGFKGFTAKGIPWSNTQYITESPAKVIGIICFLLGIPMTLFALWMMMVSATR